MWYGALAHGQIDLLDFMRPADRGPSSSQQTATDDPSEDKLAYGAYAVAAFHGQLAALKWLRARDCPGDWGVTVAAAEGGHLEIFKWCCDHFGWGDPWSVEAAINGGHVGMLDHLHKDGWDAFGESDWCATAAGAGRLDALRWLRAHGCEWDARTCKAAAYGGHLELLRWAREHGCPWDAEACRSAAISGNLDRLKYLRRHGFPWDARTCLGAVRVCNLEMLQWCVDQGCPINVEECIRNARVKWARGQEMCAWLQTLQAAGQ